MKAGLCLAAAAFALSTLSTAPLRSAELDRSEADMAVGAVIERGPHHNVLHTVRSELNGDGELTERPARIVQLEDSVNYWEEELARWAPAVAEIELIQGMGVARRGQQQALFTPNANDPEGAVTITARDGTTLRSSVLALAYFDAASGQEVILATVQDAIGELLPPNRIRYRDALSGRGGEGADAKPIGKRWRVDPENGRTVLFESADYWSLATELAPLPANDGRPRRVRQARAPAVRSSALNRWAASPDLTPVSPRLANRSLPRRSSSRTAANPLYSPDVEAGLLLRAPDAFGLAFGSLLDPKPGLVLDWTTLNLGQADYVFRGDTTYYLSGNVTLAGTNILEGGAVIKYTNAANASLKVAGSGASLRCATTPGRPAVFTSKDDNTVGETIPYSTGGPAICLNTPWFLQFDRYSGASPANLSHLRIAYANVGINFLGGSGHVVRHAQFSRCRSALGPYFCSVILRNVLVHDAINLFSSSADEGWRWVWAIAGSPSNVAASKIVSFSARATASRRIIDGIPGLTCGTTSFTGRRTSSTVGSTLPRTTTCSGAAPTTSIPTMAGTTRGISTTTPSTAPG